jgi:uncharacterized protein (DUF2062 family)
MSEGVKQFFRRRLLEPLAEQLSQGVTPGKLALALALGLVIGAIPIIGVSSLICALVALRLRLNQPAIQVANYFAYPVQIALFVPFFHAGAQLFGAKRLELSVTQLQSELSADMGATVSRYATANLRAVTAWAVVAPVAVLVVYGLLRAVLARVRLPSGRT